MTCRARHAPPLSFPCARSAARSASCCARRASPSSWSRCSLGPSRRPAPPQPGVGARVLVDGQSVVSDSQAITDLSRGGYPEVGLLGQDQAQRDETRRLVAWFDTKLNREVTELLWREKLVKRWARKGFRARRCCARGAEHPLPPGLHRLSLPARKWLAGDQLTLADLAAAAHLSVLDYMGDVPWDARHRARDWYAKMKSATVDAAGPDGPADRPQAAGPLRRSGL